MNIEIKSRVRATVNRIIHVQVFLSNKLLLKNLVHGTLLQPSSSVTTMLDYKRSTVYGSCMTLLAACHS